MGLLEALTLAAIMLPLAAMPSASVALVVARSISAGRASGIACALGIVAGDLVFVAMALAGMTVLAEWLGSLFTAVKYGAGAYLLWLGWKLLGSTADVTVAAGSGAPGHLLKDFSAGLLLTLGDIKAILFYASLFPTLVDLDRIDASQAALIVAITVLTVGGVKLAYAVFGSKLAEALHGRALARWPRRIGGGLMIGCGSVLIAKA